MSGTEVLQGIETRGEVGKEAGEESSKIEYDGLYIVIVETWFMLILHVIEQVRVAVRCLD